MAGVSSGYCYCPNALHDSEVVEPPVECHTEFIIFARVLFIARQMAALHASVSRRRRISFETRWSRRRYPLASRAPRPRTVALGRPAQSRRLP
jgi:hypothetical protein